MATLFVLAVSMGMIGSFHCVGMCGPLALSLPVKSNSSTVKFFGTLLYNVGRIVTYSFFGLVFGLIGRSASVFGFQQWLSILMGVFILVWLIFGKRLNAARFSVPFMTSFYSKLRGVFKNLYTNRRFISLFSIGLLNGLLPCGLVYMALAGATATGDLGRSIFFMAAFGLGTLPVMWAVAFFGNYVSVALRIRIRAVYPYLLGLMASLLILRGMGLGIPYISPKMDTAHTAAQHCYPVP